MRITLLIIALFVSQYASAQELPRTPMTPFASIEESEKGAGEWLQYSIDLGDMASEVSGDETIYRTTFTRPFSWEGRSAVIYIERAKSAYSLLVNGELIAQVASGATPMEFDVTRAMRDKESQIEIRLKSDPQAEELEGWSAESNEQLGRVAILSQPTLYLRDVAVRSEKVTRSGVINSTITLMVKSRALNPRTSKIYYTLKAPNGSVVLDSSTSMSLEMRGEDSITIFTMIPDSLQWSAENPNLYTLITKSQYRGRYEEVASYKIGFRSVDVTDGGVLWINGCEQSLSVAEVEPTISISELSALRDGGYNTIKISAGEYNPAIYNYADREGLYVIATVPVNTSKSGDTILRGGNPTNDPTRRAEFIERSEALYHTTQLHPSLIAFALAESSLNGYNLYESYLHLKAKGDSRPIIYLDASGEWNSDQLKLNIR